METNVGRTTALAASRRAPTKSSNDGGFDLPPRSTGAMTVDDARADANACVSLDGVDVARVRVSREARAGD